MMDGPPARWMAPSTPPPPASAELAALTITSARSRVMSPTFNFRSFSFGNFCSMRLRYRQNHFTAAAAEVHLILDALDGRAGIVPMDATRRGVAHHGEDLRLEKRVDVVHGVDLGGGDLIPIRIEAGQAG